MLKLSKEDIKLKIHETFPAFRTQHKLGPTPTVYGIPRGGWGIASLLEELRYALQVENPEEADMFADDIIDSGATKKKWSQRPFYAPYNYEVEKGPWLVFPWESSGPSDAEDIVRRLLQYIGEDVGRPGLLDTPARVVKSWKELFGGYSLSAKEILTRTFPSDSDEMVICKDIEFYSTCEHHLIPFYGIVSIGYIPKGQVVGLSKLARLVEIFARRLQIQEQLTRQIATSIEKFVPGTLGVGVVVKAKHLCMCGRGISKQGSSMITSAMLGKFRDEPETRAEFLGLI